MNSILLAILLTAGTPAFEVQTLGGKTVAGPLAELTADHLSVDAAGGRVSLPVDKLLTVSAKEKPASVRPAGAVLVELMDGSTIVGKQYAVQGAKARITLAEGEVLDAPADAVRTVQLQHEAGGLAAEWTRLVNMKADSDLLLVRKGESMDYYKGVLHDVTDDVVQFDVDGQLTPVKRAKVYGFVYHHAAVDLPAAVCRITDASGSRWTAKSLVLAEKLQWTTPAGLSVSEPGDKIVQIDFSSGKIVYLSDLKPDSVAWKPYFGTSKPLPAMEQFYLPRYDRSFESSTLQLGGVKYNKGLALRSRTEMVYRLPAGFTRFQAMVGIDDAARPAGKVHLVVHGDETVLLDSVIAGSDAPRSVDFDVTGVRRLTILVDFSDNLVVGDYLLMCDARLSK